MADEMVMPIQEIPRVLAMLDDARKDVAAGKVSALIIAATGAGERSNEVTAATAAEYGTDVAQMLRVIVKEGLICSCNEPGCSTNNVRDAIVGILELYLDGRTIGPAIFAALKPEKETIN